jgi:hypothetical protein
MTNKYLEKVAARREVLNLLNEMKEVGKLHPRQDIATVKGMLRPSTNHGGDKPIKPETFFKNRSDIRERTAKQLQDAVTNKYHLKVVANFKEGLRSPTRLGPKINEGEGGFGKGSHVWPGYNTNPNIANGNRTAKILRRMDKK